MCERLSRPCVKDIFPEKKGGFFMNEKKEKERGRRVSLDEIIIRFYIQINSRRLTPQNIKNRKSSGKEGRRRDPIRSREGAGCIPTSVSIE